MMLGVKGLTSTVCALLVLAAATLLLPVETTGIYARDVLMGNDEDRVDLDTIAELFADGYRVEDSLSDYPHDDADTGVTLVPYDALDQRIFIFRQRGTGATIYHAMSTYETRVLDSRILGGPGNDEQREELETTLLDVFTRLNLSLGAGDIAVDDYDFNAGQMTLTILFLSFFALVLTAIVASAWLISSLRSA